MLGFLSEKKDPGAKITKDRIYFVSCSNKLNQDQIKMQFASIAKQFAEKLDLNNVYLHIGKETIVYDYKI